MAGDNVFMALKKLGFEEVRFGALGPAVHYCGTWGGYAVTVSQRNYGFWADVAVRLDKGDRQTANSVADALKTQGFPKMKCVNAGDNLQFLLVFNNKTPKEDQFRAYINAIVNQLVSMGIRPAATCSICGGSNPESLFFNGSTYQPAHRGCVEKGFYETTRKAEDNKENGNYALGIVGALIGALIGMIPSIILAVIGYLAAVLFMLVPICSAYGYRKLGGKKSTASIVIIVVLSLISAFAVNIAVATVYLNSEHHLGLGPTLMWVVNYYFSGNISDLMADSIQYLLFMGLGLFGAIRYIGVTNKTEVRNGAKLAETIRPNPSFKSTAAAQTAQPVQQTWSAGTVAKPEFDSDNVAQPTWDAGTVAKPDWNAQVDAQSSWDTGASFEAGGRKKKSSGFDV